jgi:hypothetical protein
MDFTKRWCGGVAGRRLARQRIGSDGFRGWIRMAGWWRAKQALPKFHYRYRGHQASRPLMLM